MFTTKEQIDDYFSGEKIECLLCGNQFKSLGTHLRRVHGVEVDDYKVRFGLPFSRGLICNSSKSKMARIMKKRIESGDPTIMPISQVAHLGQQVPPRFQPFAQRLHSQAITRHNVQDKKLSYDDIKLAVDYLIKNNLSANEIDSDLIGMSWLTFYKRLKDYPELHDRYRNAGKERHSINFIEGGKKRTDIDRCILELSSEGKSSREISELTGVSKTTILRTRGKAQNG